MFIEGKRRGILLLPIPGHPLHSPEGLTEAADGGGNAHKEPNPNDPGSPAPGIVEPYGPAKEKSQGKRHRKAKLGQPDQKIYILQSLRPLSHISF